MAVGLRFKTFVLFINPKFWTEFLIARNHRYGVIKHEVLHLVFKHVLVSEPSKDALILNIAMDLVVNQYIEENNLPAESVFLKSFPELNLLPDQTFHYYYDKLHFLKTSIESNGDLKNSSSAQSLNSITNSSHGLDRHKLWGIISKASKVEKSVMDCQIDNIINVAKNKTSQKDYGSLPAGFRLYLDNLFIKEEPFVNWKRVLNIFSESSSKSYVKNTLKRPSKRYGTSPGIKIKRKHKLLVAIDTSGSIALEEYSEFFTELLQIWRAGAEIKVLECDAKIAKQYDFKGIIPKIIHGGGGTSFDPPIHFSNNEYKCDGIVYFTDGFAPIPSSISKVPILWVISKNGINLKNEEFLRFPGRKAKIV
ncbi:VWA-like domain-containing protein [uncultured Arcticibacterium sp.]|uniref:vWA domain-containing protein n=1 Tax=uncultured Arcticibacterium sp. TaxID=2173042 RepID=UPI0030F665A0